jgi:hypothetical protein
LRAGDVSSTNNIFAKFTFWLWVFGLEHSKWATSHSDSGVTGSWSVSWRNAVDSHIWFSVFEEAWSAILLDLLLLGFFTIGLGGGILLLLLFSN